MLRKNSNLRREENARDAGQWRRGGKTTRRELKERKLSPPHDRSSSTVSSELRAQDRYDGVESSSSEARDDSTKPEGNERGKGRRKLPKRDGLVDKESGSLLTSSK